MSVCVCLSLVNLKFYLYTTSMRFPEGSLFRFPYDSFSISFYSLKVSIIKFPNEQLIMPANSMHDSFQALLKLAYRAFHCLSISQEFRSACLL